MRNSYFLKATSVRLSLAYAAVVFFAFVFAGVLIWFGVRESAEQEVRQYIELEIHAIETELRTEGIDEAVAAIEARAEQPGALEYWLTDANGKRLAGNVRSMEGPNGWRRVAVDENTAVAAERAKERDEGRDEMLVLTKSFPDGMRLSVGEDLRRAEILRVAVLRALLAVGAAALLLCLCAGWFVTRRALAQINDLNSTMRRVASGEFSARFPLADREGASDIEELGAGVNAMLERIEDLIDGLRRVTRDVAHDLRTPLSHLQQRLERAKAETTPEARAAAIDQAQEKTVEILKTFDAILRLSEIESGSAQQRFESVDLAALVEIVSDAYRPDIEESGRALRLERLDPAHVMGDRDLLAQAMANLIENAMRHTPAGAVITLQIVAENGSVAIKVCDNGPGIPANQSEAMLKPFARLDASRSTPGSGLGLSIVAAIARLHKATLRLDNANPGLRVTFTLARAQQ